MQGVVYTALADMVIEQLGLPVWEQILDAAALPSQGAYTAGARYDDAELAQLVTLLSQHTGIAPPDLVRSFGTYLFSQLYATLPPQLQSCQNLREFLLKIDSTIHKEVKRVYPDSYLPSFKYDDSKPSELIMYYQSRRKMCFAAEGLIQGAARQFNTDIQLSHPVCMHQGADCCTLIVHFPEQK